MEDQLNGPGFHLSLAIEDYDYSPSRKLTKRQQQEQDKRSADLAAWVEANWVPCVKCQEKHPPQHGSHCIVCAVKTPLSEQRSYICIPPSTPKP